MRVKILKNANKFSVGGQKEDLDQEKTLQLDENTSSNDSTRVKTKLSPTSREHANLEAEKNETVLTKLGDDSSLPEFYTIGGKRHSKGGTPLNVPQGSFFFSDTPAMKIKNQDVLKLFNKADGKAHTPADISKQYDINKYRKILADPYSSKQDVHTAELMIKKYTEKLGKLAIAQESMKGFEDGMPKIANAYLEENNIDPIQFLGDPEEINPENFNEEEPQLSNNASENAEDENSPEPKDYTEEYAKNGGQKAKTYKVKIKRNAKFGGGGQGNIMSDNMAVSYDLLQRKLQDPKFKQEFLKQYRNELAKAKPNKKTGLTQADIDEAKSMSDDEIINTYLVGTKRVFAFEHNKSVVDSNDKNGWDQNKGAHNAAAKQLGLNEFSVPQIAAFQGAYIALDNMSRNKDYSDYFNDLELVHTGVNGDGHTLSNSSNISQIDGVWGDNTAREGVALKKHSDSQANPNDPQKNKDLQHLNDPKKESNPGFLTRDMLNFWGAVSDRNRINKYNPWSAPEAISPANPTLTDFRGAAARNNSQVASLLNSNATFSDPNQDAAFAKELSANGADNISKLQEQENSTNVNIVNNFAMQNAQRRDNYNNLEATRRKKQYDNQMSVNQNFDNARMAYRQNIRNLLGTAISNRGKLQAMNSLYDNYYYDENEMLHFKPGAGIKPSQETNSFDQWKQKLLELKRLGLTTQEAMTALGTASSWEDNKLTKQEQERLKKNDELQTQQDALSSIGNFETGNLE